MQLNTVMAEEKSLRHEIEKQANEIVVLAADLRSVGSRTAQPHSLAATLVLCLCSTMRVP